MIHDARAAQSARVTLHFFYLFIYLIIYSFFNKKKRAKGKF